MTRVIALRALGLGDLLTVVPALRALRRAIGDAELVVAMPARLAPLLDLAGVDAAVHDARGLDPPLLLPGADLAVNLHGRGPESHALLRPHAPRLVAFANPAAGADGPSWRPDEHERARWCRLVGDAFGVPADPDDVRLAVPDRETTREATSNPVVLHPGAAHRSRQWPPDRFAAVARWAVDQGLEVVVTGSAAERPVAEQVAALAARPVRVLAGRTDIGDLTHLVAHARVVICGDTGIGHLAAAYGVCSVHLFGPVSPSLWGPPRGPHVVLWHPNAGGDPWAEEPDPALLEITVEDVLDAVAEACDLAPQGT